MDRNDRSEDDAIPFFQPTPTSRQPLAGLTILVVEDSRFASEALRLMCLRSGARIRRADCLASAHRHLNTYRPSVTIVDLGLPDGSGLSLIEEISNTSPRVPVVLGTSGADPNHAEQAAKAAGADGFLPKPIQSIALFQNEILRHLPEAMRPKGPRRFSEEGLEPDRLALREDLSHAIEVLDQERPPVGYLKRFLMGLARSADDEDLFEKATALPEELPRGERALLRDLLSSRVKRMAAV